MCSAKRKVVKMELMRVLLLLALCVLCQCSLASGPSSGESFKQCLISQPAGSLGYCIGVGAISKLQSWDSTPEFDLVDGFTLSRDEKDFREGYSVLESNPNDFRSIMDSFGQVFSRRSMKWEMDWMYPGLMLRVAPSTSPGGQLEFILDPHREALNQQHALKEASTGRILTRQFLVPLLLGFKFNIATVIPIIFGLLALIAKKAVILSKVALVASSALGLGSLLFSGNGYYPYKPYGQHYGHGLGGAHPYRFPEEDYAENLYEVRQTSGRDADYQKQEDQLRLYGNFQRNQPAFQREESSNRNFAWDEKEANKA